MAARGVLSRRMLSAAALLSVVFSVAVLSTGCGGGRAKNGQGGDVLSANLALLDGEQVPEGNLAAADSLLRFEARVEDLGRMKVGQKKDVEFEFTNTGTSPVVITRIVTSCGCTSAEYEKSPTMPGRRSEIKVGFEAEEQGVFFKKVVIYYAGGESPVEVAIKGEVR